MISYNVSISCELYLPRLIIHLKYRFRFAWVNLHVKQNQNHKTFIAHKTWNDKKYFMPFNFFT